MKPGFNPNPRHQHYVIIAMEMILDTSRRIFVSRCRSTGAVSPASRGSVSSVGRLFIHHATRRSFGYVELGVSCQISTRGARQQYLSFGIILILFLKAQSEESRPFYTPD